MRCVPGAVPGLGSETPQQGAPGPLFQVLKSQRWEKKQAAAQVLGTREMHQPSAEVRGQAQPPHPGTVLVQGEAPNPGCVPVTSPSPTGPGLQREFSARPAAWDPETPEQCQPGASRARAWGQACIPQLGAGYVGTEQGFTWWERPHSPSECPSSPSMSHSSSSPVPTQQDRVTKAAREGTAELWRNHPSAKCHSHGPGVTA